MSWKVKEGEKTKNNTIRKLKDRKNAKAEKGRTDRKGKYCTKHSGYLGNLR